MAYDIEDIKKYALEHYSQDGWDVLVECYDDEDIRFNIKLYEDFHSPVVTLEDAIKAVSYFLKIGHDQMIDSWADGGLCVKCGSADHEACKCPNGA